MSYVYFWITLSIKAGIFSFYYNYYIILFRLEPRPSINNHPFNTLYITLFLVSIFSI